jgi:hypothetical protein
MLTGFEKETAPLTDYELTTLLPIIIEDLEGRIGPGAAVKNATLCGRLRREGYDITEARFRKLIAHIRVSGKVPCLIATSRGYYRSLDVDELQTYIDSLEGRENAIRQVRLALERQKEDNILL